MAARSLGLCALRTSSRRSVSARRSRASCSPSLFATAKASQLVTAIMSSDSAAAVRSSSVDMPPISICGISRVRSASRCEASATTPELPTTTTGSVTVKAIRCASFSSVVQR